MPTPDQNYHRGYTDGMAGRPLDQAGGVDYEDGWYDGEADRIDAEVELYQAVE